MERGEDAEGEKPLSGGFVTEAVKVDDTVRRAVGPWSPAVHSLLSYLENVGYDAAPRATSSRSAATTGLRSTPPPTTRPQFGPTRRAASARAGSCAPTSAAQTEHGTTGC
jgi:hypothetical protein